MSLVIITFFASIQYSFLKGVPENISTFEFLFITSLIGFFLLLFVFFNELFRVDLNHMKQCAILSIESFIYSFLLILGSKGMDSTTVSSVVSSYFIFIPVLEFIIFKSKPQKNILIAIVLVLSGVFLIMGLDIDTLASHRIIFLIMTDIMIAINIITIGVFAKGSNPAILAMGQLFFTTIISLVLWTIESKINGALMVIPREPQFWGSTIFISFFIRGIYTVVQIYAQRYVSPVNAALIFSSEIIMTMFASSFVLHFLNYESTESPITLVKAVGVIVMLAGILISDSNFVKVFKMKGIKIDNIKEN